MDKTAATTRLDELKADGKTMLVRNEKGQWVQSPHFDEVGQVLLDFMAEDEEVEDGNV